MLTQNNIVLQAGIPVQFSDLGDFFRLMAANGALDVEFFYNGQLVVDGEGVTEGYSEHFTSGQYDKIQITSAGGDTVSFVSRLGNVVDYNKPPVGNVAITNTAGPFTHVQASVTNVDQVLIAANAQLRIAEIQNNSAAGVLRLKLDGTAASPTIGIRVQPGGMWSAPAGYVMTNAVHGCMEAADATANNVEVVWG